MAISFLWLIYYKVHQVLQAFQGIQKATYDRRHCAWDLPKLLVCQKLFHANSGDWKPAVITKVRPKPSSDWISTHKCKQLQWNGRKLEKKTTLLSQDHHIHPKWSAFQGQTMHSHKLALPRGKVHPKGRDIHPVLPVLWGIPSRPPWIPNLTLTDQVDNDVCMPVQPHISSLHPFHKLLYMKFKQPSFQYLLQRSQPYLTHHCNMTDYHQNHK